MRRRGRRRRRMEREKVELEALLLTAAWVASLPSLTLPPCLTDTVCTRLGIGSCPVATWHKYSPASDTWKTAQWQFMLAANVWLQKSRLMDEEGTVTVTFTAIATDREVLKKCWIFWEFWNFLKPLLYCTAQLTWPKKEAPLRKISKKSFFSVALGD